MAKKMHTFTIGIPIYEGVDLLDVAAPYEMFNWMGEEVKTRIKVKVHVLAETTKTVKTRDGLRLSPQKTFKKAPQLDLLWVPGGDPKALEKMMHHPPYIDFLLKQSEQATYVASVCEGALLLASAGLLNGYRATTHWAFINCLKSFPEIKVAKGFPRFVINKFRDASGKLRYVVTGGGISSGLDEALELVKLIVDKETAESVQLTTQYFPEPPVKGHIPTPGDCPLL